jgi:hypothetical protein
MTGGQTQTDLGGRDVMADDRQFTWGAFLQHLGRVAEPFVLRRADREPRWADEPVHDAAFRRDPELYALSAVAPGVGPEQQARILFQLLRRSRAGYSEEVRQTQERVTACVLSALPPAQVLTVFLAVRRCRANHKHTARAVLQYILNHPDLEALAAARRPALVDSLEHALGKATARGSIRALADKAPYDSFLQRTLLRFANDPGRVEAVLPTLYRRGAEAAARCRRPWSPEAKVRPAVCAADRPKTVTATNRGDIAATLVHLYHGGASPDLRQALDEYVGLAAARLPRFEGAVGLILDASASTRGYGEREYACLSQSWALRLVLQRCCANLRVYQVGGSGDPPRPEGATDLAGAVLDALAGEPDVVAVVSDGYENTVDGDLARVAAMLPAVRCRTPVVFCHSTFTPKDDLVLRRPAANLPEVAFWHEDEFAGLLLTLFAQAGNGKGEAFLRQHLSERLALVEKETASWITAR